MQVPTLKRALAAGGAAVLLGGAAFGVVSAQQATPTPGPTAPANSGQQQFLTTLASKLGIPVDKLQQAISDTRQQVGANGPGPLGGPGGPRGGRPGQLVRGAVLGHELQIAAQAIGITPAQLRQELPGKTLTQVAQAHNVDPGTVANALKSDAENRINQAVSNGRLTADQGNQAKQRVDNRIDQAMNQTVPQNVGGGPNGRGPRGAGRPGGPGPMGGIVGQEAQVAAQAIGISVDQLRQGLPGKSLAQVAQAHNVDPATVANAIKSDLHNRVDQQVDQLMTRTMPQGGPGPKAGQPAGTTTS